MIRIPKGFWAVGALVAFACGVMLWQGFRLPPSNSPSAGSPQSEHLSASPLPSSSAQTGDETVSSPPVERDEIVVHVAGAVKRPGVVRIPRGSRVDDAVKAAGGFSSQADPDSVNLAQPLEDGVQVYVPRKGEAVQVEGRVGSLSAHRASERAAAGRRELPSGKININTATAEQLESLPGVGPATAHAVIEYRQQNGGFGSVDELLEVRGIGPKKLEQIRPYVTVR
jgi:competence protein ComEA